MESSLEMDMFMKYPSIVPITSDEYNGYLTVEDEDYSISFTTTCDEIKVNYDRCAKLIAFRDEIDQIRIDSNDILAFVTNLEALLRSKSKRKCSSFEKPYNYKQFLEDFCEFTRFYVGTSGSYATPTLDYVKLCYIDEMRRNHSIGLTIKYENNSHSYKLRECSFDTIALPQNGSLINIYEKYKAFLESVHMQHFFSVFDEIDGNCWVIDPEVPSYNIKYRRIVLDNSLSAVLHVCEKDPRSCPAISFFGSQDKVDKYVARLDSHFGKWDTDANFVEELLKVFELTSFPMKPRNNEDTTKLINIGDCCICFSGRLDDQLADIVCSNKACNQYFHKECLYKYLLSKNANQSFFVLKGDCPYCKMAIQCPVITNLMN